MTVVAWLRRSWGAVRADFERALADPVDLAIASAEIASELRGGAGYVRVTVALKVLTADIADAPTIAWEPSAAPPRMTPQAGRWPPPRRTSSRSYQSH